ncbi:protein of unknown function [Pararobbsia alpina]
MKALAHRLFPRYGEREALHFLWAYFGIGLAGMLLIATIAMRCLGM